MESENNTPPVHSYPNADRPIGENRDPAAPKPLVHIGDAMNNAKKSPEDMDNLKTIRKRTQGRGFL